MRRIMLLALAMLASLTAHAGEPHLPQPGDVAQLLSTIPEPVAIAHAHCTVVRWDVGPSPWETISLQCNKRPDLNTFYIWAPATHHRCTARGWGIGDADKSTIVLTGEHCKP